MFSTYATIPTTKAQPPRQKTDKTPTKTQIQPHKCHICPLYYAGICRILQPFLIGKQEAQKPGAAARPVCPLKPYQKTTKRHPKTTGKTYFAYRKTIKKAPPPTKNGTRAATTPSKILAGKSEKTFSPLKNSRHNFSSDFFLQDFFEKRGNFGPFWEGGLRKCE